MAPQGYDIAQDDEETQMLNRRQRSRPRDDGWRHTMKINIDCNNNTLDEIQLRGLKAKTKS